MSEWGKQEIKDGDEFAVQWTPEGIWVQDKKTGIIKFDPAVKDHFGNVICEIIMTTIDAKKQSVKSVSQESKS